MLIIVCLKLRDSSKLFDVVIYHHGWHFEALNCISKLEKDVKLLWDLPLLRLWCVFLCVLFSLCSCCFLSVLFPQSEVKINQEWQHDSFNHCLSVYYSRSQAGSIISHITSAALWLSSLIYAEMISFCYETKKNRTGIEKDIGLIIFRLSLI